MKCPPLLKCDYYIVEVIEKKQSGTSVLFLEKLDDFASVYYAQVEVHCLVILKIPTNELHHISAFRLTEERGDKLRGYLELNTTTLPLH